MLRNKSNTFAIAAMLALCASATMAPVAAASHSDRDNGRRSSDRRNDDRRSNDRHERHDNDRRDRDHRDDDRRGHDRRIERSRADVDIDELRGELRILRLQPELKVRYEIEIEDARPGETFTLQLRLHVNGRTVRDITGRAIAASIPLRVGSRCDDEVEFRNEICTKLRPLSACDIGGLRVEARVISNCDGRVLDCSDRSVSLRR